MAQTVADQFAEILAAAGVRRVPIKSGHDASIGVMHHLNQPER
jgi:hypothetical protein